MDRNASARALDVGISLKHYARRLLPLRRASKISRDGVREGGISWRRRDEGFDERTSVFAREESVCTIAAT